MPTTLSWDDIGARYFELGVDRGVLYREDGTGLAWSGLTSISENPAISGRQPLYFDGVKYSETAIISEYAGILKAYTYPEEFMEYEGNVEVGEGLRVTSQPAKRFGLSYRTKIGNDEEGTDYGYKIHILYNLTAVPANRVYQSMRNSLSPIEFEWNLTGIPSPVPGYRPTVHLIIDSRSISPTLLQDIENSLYGDGLSTPTLPPAENLVGFIGTWVVIRIIDNFDGTWTAISARDEDIVVNPGDSTEYTIYGANITMINADTYTISDTTF